MTISDTRNLEFLVDVADDLDQDELDRLQSRDTPCPICGSVGTCGYDAEGRPMIHSDAEDEP